MAMTKFLYLDQHDLSNLGKNLDTGSRARLTELTHSGDIRVVLSRHLAIETAKYDNLDARESIISFVDGLPGTCWLWDPMKLMQAEVEWCTANYLQGKRTPLPCPFAESYLESVYIRPTSKLTDWDDAHEYSSLVSVYADKDTRLAKLLGATVGDWRRLRSVIRARSGGEPIPRSRRDEALLKFVPKETPSRISIDDKTRREILEKLDLTTCPAHQLYCEVEHSINKQSRPGTPSEFVDEMHLYAVPYCDVTTTDKAMRSIVVSTPSGKRLAARIAVNAAEALDIIAQR